MNAEMQVFGVRFRRKVEGGYTRWIAMGERVSQRGTFPELIVLDKPPLWTGPTYDVQFETPEEALASLLADSEPDRHPDLQPYGEPAIGGLFKRVGKVLLPDPPMDGAFLLEEPRGYQWAHCYQSKYTIHFSSPLEALRYKVSSQISQGQEDLVTLGQAVCARLEEMNRQRLRLAALEAYRDRIPSGAPT